ncbi:uncharacterized protein LOC135375691 [Ornithodoros turicata]|uniref:uncharacterized protein LOC135375691 n=1 Tax=Ornithodoros turicata TaxID=34597 RepID=UPI00313A2B86
MVNHAANIHEGHNGMLTRCLHKPLDNRSWLRKGSPAHKRLEEIVTAPVLTRAIKQLSPHTQTFALESFHNVINQFAPKSVAFSYFGMQARTYIAILHFNENSSRLQATTKDGRLQWKLKAPKAKAGEMIASPVMTQATFGYVNDQLDETLRLASIYITFAEAFANAECDVPPPMTHRIRQRPSKDDVVAGHVSRFATAHTNPLHPVHGYDAEDDDFDADLLMPE